MVKDQDVRIENVGGIEIWLVGDVSHGGRLKAIEMAQMAVALQPKVHGYRMYVAARKNRAACAWAKADIVRRGAHEILMFC